jgi:hypothetical protein
MSVAEHTVGMITARQQESALHLLESSEESNTAPRHIGPEPTREIFREHDPSLGINARPSVEFQPVILTSSAGHPDQLTNTPARRDV